MANLSTAEMNELIHGLGSQQLANSFRDAYNAIDVLSSTEAGYLDGSGLEVTASKCVVANASGSIEFADAATAPSIVTGTYQSTADGGNILSSTNTYNAGFLADDSGSNIGDSVRNVLARTLLTIDQSGGSIRSLMGQLKLLTGIDVATGVYTAVQGYLEMAGTHGVLSGATFSCIDASAEITTALTVASGGEFCGVHVETTGAGTITNNGTCAGVLIDKAAGAADWPVGVSVNNSIVGVYIANTSGIGLSVVTSALTVGDSTSGVRVAVTAAAASNAYGMAGYFDSTITGTTAGHCYGLGSWINTGTTPVLSAGHIIVPLECGVYTGEAQATARVVLGQFQAILDGAPASLHVFRINTTQTTTAVFAAANAGSIGFTAGAGTSGTQVGYIPIADVVGTGVVYIRVYDSAS